MTMPRDKDRNDHPARPDRRIEKLIELNDLIPSNEVTGGASKGRTIFGSTPPPAAPKRKQK
jgi:hypothetical protein